MKQVTPKTSRDTKPRVSTSNHRRPRILIADDDPGIRDVFKIIFDRAGFEIELKCNGDDLLINHFALPDIFLIDKQLSGHDGLDICRFLKKQEKTKHIPVIMISASPDISVMAIKAGADCYIEKPFEVRHLLDTIQQCLERNA